MSRNRKRLLLFFTLVVFSLLTSLTPITDIDKDGSLDSLVTEGLLLAPTLGALTGLLFLLTRLPSACLAAPQLLSSLLLPPPIPTR